MSKQFKNMFNHLLQTWYKAMSGQQGTKGILVALTVLVVLVVLVIVALPYFFQALVVISRLVIISVLVLIVALVLGPPLARSMAKRGFFAGHNTVVVSESEQKIYEKAVNCKQINLNVTYANVTLSFTDKDEVEISYQITEGQPHFLSYALNYDELTETLSFNQGSNQNKNILTYNLFINVPKSYKIALGGKLVEGKLNIEGTHTLEKVDIDAVNLPISLKDCTIENLKLTGLNLKLDSNNIAINYASVMATGSQFNLHLAAGNKGAKLKTNSAIASFSLNNKPLGKMFNHSSFLLWEAAGGDYAMYEFNVITSQINFYTTNN
ncbi:MAG: hypothetical protein FWE37_00630 [Spirochaetaceae bacterium]|nr:hypothetical protein [Spirochaetaceae bacterium]